MLMRFFGRTLSVICTAGVVAVGVAAALGGCDGTTSNKHTIQECAALLPKGDLYMLDIRGMIDTGVTPPAIEGGFEVVSEGATRAEMKAFSECMKAVIQPRSVEAPSISTSAPDTQSPPSDNEETSGTTESENSF